MLSNSDTRIELLSRARLVLPFEFYTTLIHYRDVNTQIEKIDCLWYDENTQLIIICVSTMVLDNIVQEPEVNRLAIEQIRRKFHNSSISSQTIIDNIYQKIKEYNFEINK
ncbi:MAG: hypothetical protein ACRCXZ_02320 [Patescibacteria group bacterium]